MFCLALATLTALAMYVMTTSVMSCNPQVTSDLKGQLVHIAGSLAIFGSPANMMRNIGDGVSDFFYEPVAGMRDSPAAFMKGLGKGTSSLMGGVGE